MDKEQKITIITGPTASGKSSYAIDLAEEKNGVIINADSLQVYEELRIITARPSIEDEAKTPHKMYGIIDHTKQCTAHNWSKTASKHIEEAWANNQLPIVVGGTGFYIKSLTEGLSPIPEIPMEEKQKVKNEYYDSKNKDAALKNLYAELMKADEDTARKLAPNDSQRIIRAVEVYRYTKKPLSFWQKRPLVNPLNIKREHLDINLILVMPDKEKLYKRSDDRFIKMMDMGAIEEVEKLNKLNIPDYHILKKAIGVNEITKYLNGELTKDEMIKQGQTATKKYMKKQMTWFRHQIKPNQIIN